MEVAGGVTRLGWLRCNGEKRWIKVGHEFIEVWLTNTEEKAVVRYVWTKWAVLSLEVRRLPQRSILPIPCTRPRTPSPPRPCASSSGPMRVHVRCVRARRSTWRATSRRSR